MLAKSLALGSAAVSAGHFRALSMSLVNGPTETDVTLLRTMAWRRGSGELHEITLKMSFYFIQNLFIIINFKGGFGGCNDAMVQSQAVASTGLDSCSIQSTGASCGGVSQVEVLISYRL